MFIHCPHVSFIGAYQVFDKMFKWYFCVVLDSNEYQTLENTMIIHVYHVLIIGCVFYTLWPNCAKSYLAHASHRHTICTLDAHTCTIVTCFTFHWYYMLVWHCFVPFRTLFLLLWTNLDLINFVFLFCILHLFFCCVFVCADVSH